MKRFTFSLIVLTLLPAVLSGIVLVLSLWIYVSPTAAITIFSHWEPVSLIVSVLLGCLILARIVSHRILEQLELLTQYAGTLTLGEKSFHIKKHLLYKELHPLYEHIKKNIEFHETATGIMQETLRHPDSRTLPVRSEEDEFVKTLNRLMTRLQRIQEIMTNVSKGNLAALELSSTSDIGVSTHIQIIISELIDFVSKSRHYTNQIVQTGSQINSLSVQGLQDTKIATKRIDDILLSIRAMTDNLQRRAEQLQEQSCLLDDTSYSTEHTIQSIEEIASHVTQLKNSLEQYLPSAQVSEKSSFPLDVVYETTAAIEEEANTCMTLSHAALQDAERGKEVMEHTISGINQIQQLMDKFFNLFRRLGERSEEVSETLETISDIADHTNLLAINAAIISAHAGEHGRDFAIIADEIGKFAERTRESTSEIEELLRTIQHEFREAVQIMAQSVKAMSHGVALSHKAGKTLDNLSSSIHRTNAIVTRIAAATTAQSSESERMRQVMEESKRWLEEKHEHLNTTLWQLLQTIAQIHEIASKQAEGSAQMAEMVRQLDHMTQKAGESTSLHLTSANQIMNAVEDIRKFVQRITFGSEKATVLTNELFSLGGNLAFTTGEFLLSDSVPSLSIPENVPLIGFGRRGPDRFFDDIGTGIREEARQYGFEILEMNAQYEATTQVEHVNWMLKQPAFKGIILCPTDKNVAQKLVHKSNLHEIPVIAADESIPTTISIRSSSRKGGRRAAELFIERLPQGAAIAVIVDRMVESMVQRGIGFRQKAEKYALDVIEVYCDMTNKEDVKKYIISAIVENPGIQGIFLTNETVTTEYIHALRSGILPSTRLLAVGYDQTELVEEAIRRGELLGVIFQHPTEIGKQAFQYLYKLINKEIRVEDFDEKTIYIPTVQVTKETLTHLLATPESMEKQE